jgi:hypothetical protein
MERLEAAMVKARAARRQALGRRPDALRGASSETGAPEIDGAPLPALQIGPGACDAP